MDAEFSKDVNEIATTIPMGKANEIAYHDYFIFHIMHMYYVRLQPVLYTKLQK